MIIKERVIIAEGRVWIGWFSILFDERNGKYVAICRNCGCELSQLDIKAIETGFYYCSITCAKEDVAAEMEYQKGDVK